MKQFAKSILDVIYPPICLVCDCPLYLLPEKNGARVLKENGNSFFDCDLLCDSCNPLFSRDASASLHPFQVCRTESRQNGERMHGEQPAWCDRCGEPLKENEEEDKRCEACVFYPLPFRRLRSLYRYSLKLEAVIKALKYRLRRPLATYLGRLLAGAILQTPVTPCFFSKEALFSEEDWDLLVALPSSAGATCHRGFGHVTLIARELGKQTDLPVSVSALCSQGKRPAQASLPLLKRFQNTRNAFRAFEKEVSQKRVLLIDDVTTTGASLFFATTALLDAGAKSVDALTIARSWHFSRWHLSFARSR